MRLIYAALAILFGPALWRLAREVVVPDVARPGDAGTRRGGAADLEVPALPETRAEDRWPRGFTDKRGRWHGPPR